MRGAHARARAELFSGQWAWTIHPHVRSPMWGNNCPYSLLGIVAPRNQFMSHTRACVGTILGAVGLDHRSARALPSLVALNNLLAISDHLACPLLVSTWIFTRDHFDRLRCFTMVLPA